MLELEPGTVSLVFNRETEISAAANENGKMRAVREMIYALWPMIVTK